VRTGRLAIIVVLVGIFWSIAYFKGHTHGHEFKFLNLPYGEDPMQVLDVYTPNEQTDGPLPAIIYVHGGGWTRGTKSNVNEKPSFFANKGYVFISAGYRLSPKANYTQMAEDISSAVKWVYDHADQYHIDRKRLNLMGHSAGGHLVTLIGTDTKYLSGAGLSPNAIKSIVNLEGPTDLTTFISRFPQYKSVFGLVQHRWVEASPITYANQSNLPPVLIASRRDSSVKYFQKTAQEAGNTVDYFECETLNHREITKLLGSSHPSAEAHTLTNAVMEFLKQNNTQDSPQ